MSRTLIYVHVNIILDFPLQYTNASVFCQPECAFLHQTVIMVVFFIKIMKIPNQKGKHSWNCTELSLKKRETPVLKTPADLCIYVGLMVFLQIHVMLM